MNTLIYICQTSKLFRNIPSTKNLANTLKMVKDKKVKTQIKKISVLTDEEKLGQEEKNIVDSFSFAKSLGLFV